MKLRDSLLGEAVPYLTTDGACRRSVATGLRSRSIRVSGGPTSTSELSQRPSAPTGYHRART